MKLKISNASGRVQAETVRKCKQQASLHYHAPRITEGDLHTSTAHQQQYGDRIVDPARVGKALSAQFNKLYTFFRVCGDIKNCSTSTVTWSATFHLQRQSTYCRMFLQNWRDFLMYIHICCLQETSAKICHLTFAFPTCLGLPNVKVSVSHVGFRGQEI